MGRLGKRRHAQISDDEEEQEKISAAEGEANGRHDGIDETNIVEQPRTRKPTFKVKEMSESFF